MTSQVISKRAPYISTPREARFLSNILYGAVSAKELRGITGSENIWNTAKIMREKGWRIQTINRPVYDRDGNRTHAGYYLLENEQREHAKGVLDEYYQANDKSEGVTDEAS